MFFEFLGCLALVIPMRNQRKTGSPRSYTWKWTFRRKAALLQAISSGTLTAEQARDVYGLSIEELRAWERDFERDGLYGLRATRVSRIKGPSQ